MRKIDIKMYSVLFLLFMHIVSFSKTISANNNLYDWSFKTGKHISSSVYIDDGILYAGSFDSIFYALDLNGNMKWKFNSGYPIKCQATSADSIVCFQSGNRLFGLNKNKGNLIWIHQPNEATVNKPVVQLDSWDFKDSSPIYSEGTVYYCNEYGSVYGVDLYTGNQVFVYKTTNKSPIRTKAVIQNNTIYFGDHEGYIYAVSLSDSKLFWSVRTNNGSKPYAEFGGIFGDMIINGSNLYFGIRNSNFQVLDINTGAKVWSYESGGTWLSGTPLINNAFTYVGTSDTHQFMAFDNESGKLMWSIPVTNSVYNAALLINDNLFVFTGDEKYPVSVPGHGTINIVDLSGNTINKINIKGSVFGSPVIYGEKIYFGSFDGCIHCISVENITSKAQSSIELDQNDLDLGLIDKNVLVVKPICYIKNRGTKADSIICTPVVSNLSEAAINLFPGKCFLAANDSILIKVQLKGGEIDNGKYQFIMNVEPVSKPEMFFEKKIEFTKEIVTGFERIKNESNIFKIYPNPCESDLTVELDLKNAGDMRIVLYDMDGSEMLSRQVNVLSPSKVTIAIPTEGLASQNYICQVFLNKIPFAPFKFIKE